VIHRFMGTTILSVGRFELGVSFYDSPKRLSLRWLHPTFLRLKWWRLRVFVSWHRREREPAAWGGYP
jgi:hypothetical protein